MPAVRQEHPSPRNRRHLAPIAALLLAVSMSGAAQGASLIGETTWGGPAAESVGDAAVAADGSTYLAGFTTSFGTTSPTLFVVKFDAVGALLWQRTWEGPEQFGTDQATDVAVATDGSVYVTGSTQGAGGDALLLKLTSGGGLTWQRRWGGAAFESGEAVAATADGGAVVVGGTRSFGGENDLFVVRFAADGSVVWERSRADALGQSVDVAADGSIFVAGPSVRPGGIAESDLTLLKITGGGTLAFQRAHSSFESSDARGGLVVASDGAIYVAGAVQDSSKRVIVDASLLKFNADGSLAFDRSWGGRSGDVSAGLGLAPDGTIVWSGDTNSYGAGNDDAFVLQVSSEGRVLDASTWGGPGIDHGDGVDVAAGGTISLGATTESPPTVFLDAPSKTSRLRGTVSAPTTPLVDVSGTLADPAGVLSTPAGTTPGQGGFDAALVRIGP